ncbi:heme NO-binding domain-containing protein [Ideonella sp. 4Y16]|uniref:Heme NO-binding domain-containing protein n=1 Tax=Ideonella alba TaxID=2824118 RepID=A0A940YD20_9BURK|nr:heme NO-binding domain-containing protein [Ideonella alba]MBQ0931928.1 heme NO-binding domain-containing protein [Ideonella alba]MBQ0942563.1 heme NO-binding domain-containing protein [Ideonella alba]
MLGMVFTEFIEMVEARFSPEVADAVLADAGLAHGGAYTAVGYYPAEELQAMVLGLARRSGHSADELVRSFGSHLAQRFSQAHGHYFAAHRHPFDLIAAIDGHIHVEVRKLYPQAQLPHFDVLERSSTQMRMRYRSERRLQMLALGLIEGVMAHYGCRGRVSMAALDDGAEFLLEDLT